MDLLGWLTVIGFAITLISFPITIIGLILALLTSWSELQCRWNAYKDLRAERSPAEVSRKRILRLRRELEEVNEYAASPARLVAHVARRIGIVLIVGIIGVQVILSSGAVLLYAYTYRVGFPFLSYIFDFLGEDPVGIFYPVAVFSAFPLMYASFDALGVFSLLWKIDNIDRYRIYTQESIRRLEEDYYSRHGGKSRGPRVGGA